MFRLRFCRSLFLREFERKPHRVLKVFSCFLAFYVFCFPFRHSEIMHLLLVCACLFLWAPNADGNHAQDSARAQSVNNQPAREQIAAPGESKPQANVSTAKQGNNNQRPWYKEPQWVAVFLTAIYVGATIYYVCISRQMLGQISKQGELAQDQVIEMARQREIMRLQWRSTHEQVGNMDRQLGEMGRQTAAAKQAAEAAQQS